METAKGLVKKGTEVDAWEKVRIDQIVFPSQFHCIKNDCLLRI